MRKYFSIFKTEFARLLELRLDFWMGRAISIVTLLTNYFLWTTVFANRQDVFGYSLEKMIAYVVGIAVLYNIIFVHSHERIGWEIVEGTFATYLVRPVSYFWYAVAVSAGKRILYFVSIAFTIAFVFFFFQKMFVQTDVVFLTLFVVAVLAGITIYTFLDYLLGISSFWFYRSVGLRWMFLMIIVLASGAAFPIDLLPLWLSRALFATPFPYIVFFPLNVYLGRPDVVQIVYGFAMGLFWIAALAFVTHVVWRRGLRRFEGSGI